MTGLGQRRSLMHRAFGQKDQIAEMTVSAKSGVEATAFCFFQKVRKGKDDASTSPRIGSGL